MQYRGPTTPARPEPRGFGLLPGRSPLLGESLLFSLPPGTKMFQFPGFASAIHADDGPSDRRVAPFGHLRVTGRLHLTGAFRSLPRPSSPSRAKASAVRPFFLSPPVWALRIPASSLGLYLSLLARVTQSPETLLPAFIFCSIMSMSSRGRRPVFLVENNGFEPLTPCLQSRCSSQLS